MNSESGFRQSVRELIDTVFTDDMAYFDLLPEKVDRELGTPMAALIPMMDGLGELDRLIDSARLVEEIATDLGDVVPADLSDLIRAMSTARLHLVEELGQRMEWLQTCPSSSPS